jgi:hypothetical protein
MVFTNVLACVCVVSQLWFWSLWPEQEAIWLWQVSQSLVRNPPESLIISWVCLFFGFFIAACALQMLVAHIMFWRWVLQVSGIWAYPWPMGHARGCWICAPRGIQQVWCYLWSRGCLVQGKSLLVSIGCNIVIVRSKILLWRFSSAIS